MKKDRHVILSFILLITGFMIAFSYQFTLESMPEQKSETKWEKENLLRDKLINEQKENRKLQKQLQKVQEKVSTVEKELSKDEQITYNLVEDLDRLRMVVGDVPVEGPGVKVTLSDASYVPEDDNPNNYIVHEQDIRRVMFELLITGAEAISINGQRVFHDSYILCIGPVVEVDGNQHFAPFEISAIGDPEMLDSALNLAGNTKDQLITAGIDVKIEKQDKIVMKPYLSREG
ncbi:DUF881 domain-containing protein [Pseudalkalibacillus caeni]|uniref:DUF881 domain-containing protein n=1 Tax=Exobacillus caeni TaxID=2574798 RepID=A0A5R9EYG9_9BACL|nr:DUF881 domain-containing protein [Pseudalkalibacillus caeni]TLS35246.1 DUF881 domain-containing protein [Pseudalkalibacillus caeni]